MVTVLQVIPSLNAGGAERTTVEIAEALTGAGWRALVASAGGVLDGDLAVAGGALIRMRTESKNPLTMALNARRLRGIIAREKVDLVHARSRAPAWSTLWAARKAGVPFITTYHGPYSGRSAIKRWYNGVMARGDIVIANSAYMRDRIVDRHGIAADRVRVIPRGVDLASFDPAAVSRERAAAMRASWGLAPDERRPVLLLPARMTARKGHAVALKALAMLADLDAFLVFAGEGPAGPALLEQAAALGLGPRLVLAGHVADMPAAYAASDLVLAPSILPEAFGRTAAEAQAMRVPVIAAAHGGALEVVQDGTSGFLVPPGDIEALAAAIQRVLTLAPDARARLTGAAREGVASRYTARALQDATLRVYREALGLR